jgi:magnesium chelatase subunit I
MVYGDLPVTLPINATDDRVVGGWKIDELLINQQPVRQPGLLAEADRRGVLYIDEVNLLEDHIVNLILDVASTGNLSVQYEGQDEELRDLSFTLIGTMNPEEGLLRPQLLDRFGLMVDVTAEADPDIRKTILSSVLRFDAARSGADQTAARWLEEGRAADRELAQKLREARDRLYDVAIDDAVLGLCADLAARFAAAGHRGDYVMALAARAAAARDAATAVDQHLVAQVARLAMQHRRMATVEGGQLDWTGTDDDLVAEVIRSR